MNINVAAQVNSNSTGLARKQEQKRFIYGTIELIDHGLPLLNRNLDRHALELDQNWYSIYSPNLTCPSSLKDEPQPALDARDSIKSNVVVKDETITSFSVG